MSCAIIVAVSKNGIIGREGDLPWHLPADLAYFKSLTSGNPIIMGRKTYESIGRPLPKRTNIVITRQSDFAAMGCKVTSSLESALTLAEEENPEKTFVIGGGEIYRQALERVDEVYLTEVDIEVDGNVNFPELNSDVWQCVSRDAHEPDEKNKMAYTFCKYTRK